MGLSAYAIPLQASIGALQASIGLLQASIGALLASIVAPKRPKIKPKVTTAIAFLCPARLVSTENMGNVCIFDF